jgi:pyruvate dehydrogenase E2 component (dihydrolipoamide acetyltransferase)
MRQKLLMPKLGLTMTEGQLVEWLIPVGSPFKTDDGLFVIETDKVATEIPAEAEGLLTEVAIQPGEMVKVGDVVGYWEPIGEVAEQSTAAVGNEPAGMAVAEASGLAPVTDLASVARMGAVSKTATGDDRRIPVTPLARRLAQQLNIDLKTIRGSGPNERIKAADVQAAAVLKSLAVSTEVPAMAATGQGNRTIPTSLQATIARRLTAAKQQIPHFYLSLDVTVSRLLKLRAELNALEGPVRLTLNNFIVAAVGRSLNDLPEVNRVWSDDAIVSFSESDVGVAVNTDRGLFVPIVRDAGRLSLTELARDSQKLVERARSGTLTAGDMGGGAITVSNAGMFNVKYMTSIINPGQAMILGVGSITQTFRPDAEGRPELRDEMGLVLACDHRIMDGVSGLKILNRIAAYLEQPMKLLVGNK